MVQIERQKFDGVKRTVPSVFSDLNLVRCEFTACALSQFDDPSFSLRVKSVSAENCVVKRCAVHGVAFEDVRLTGLTVRSALRLEGCIFKHVKVSGDVGTLLVTPPNHALSEALRAEFERSAVDHYSDVDWAIDITTANFAEVDLYYVPGNLIRRDPETQFLLHRDRLAAIESIDLPTYSQIAVSRFEASPFPSLVAIAPRRSKNFEQRLEDLSELRRLGVAD